MQGKSHPVQVKETYCTVIQTGYLQAFILQPGMYNVHCLCPPRRLMKKGTKKGN